MTAHRAPARRPNWWPLTRLLIVAAALASQAYWVFGWRVPLVDPMALPGKIGVGYFCLLFLSTTLAYLYMLLFLLSLVAFVLLHDYSYDACHWTFRMVLRLRCRPLLAACSLGGELAFFGGSFSLLRHWPRPASWRNSFSVACG